ncbi:PP2C family protein-serine/threonine phosphatase [Desulforhopalus singaporensis]|nr:SpoIIE family protein phosphatase [Desulforhopalus singaporensis]
MIKYLRTLRPTSLKQKTAVFILLPTFLIMAGIGTLSLNLMGKVLLEQWQQTAIAKLHQSAHYVDMRLMRPKEVLQFLQQKEQDNLRWNEIQVLLDQLENLDGVVSVNHEWTTGPAPDAQPTKATEMMHRFTKHRLTRITLSLPQYNPQANSKTVSMFAWFEDQDGHDTGYIEVILSFLDLIDQIVKSPWWKSNKAFIVDGQRNILASTPLVEDAEQSSGRVVFGKEDRFEAKTWEAMVRNSSGTVFSPGMVPEKISGFYRLAEAPWTLVITAPGEQVLRPILNFRLYYFIIGGVGILVALSYIHFVTEQTTRAINRLSSAADDLARGKFSEPLMVDSRDEVGDLTTSFNLMTRQLKERLQLQQAMDIAREVQQNLLPRHGFSADGLEVAGTTLYCDATGGDYIDLLDPSVENKSITVVVGDVVGHGIGAALLMATVRALLRGRASRPGSLAEVINDVNRLLCKDTSRSGNFVTLFCLEIDQRNKLIRWVRCGHDCALHYWPAEHVFKELRGEGLALGVDATFSYESNSIRFTDDRQLILLGSDGVWEAENKQGEMFGKQRVKSIISKCHELPAEKIIDKITEEIILFQDGAPQNDDITLVVIKTW